LELARDFFYAGKARAYFENRNLPGAPRWGALQIPINQGGRKWEKEKKQMRKLKKASRKQMRQ
jgi:hypothetical protein